MEASALSSPKASSPALLGRSPLLRLQSDEKLITLVRRGHPGAFDALVQRYQSRLHSFCRHMLGSTEDAEDVLQEVFASAYNAICADNRPINARPWLYRIARNRALNHMRRPSHAGQDSMDVFERAGGETAADAVHRREDFRLLIADVQGLPESQRTALLMREIDALSYEHISEAMETTVPSVKSLLVRARVGLAEAAEARLLSCDQVRIHLGEAAEGIAKIAPAVRRHVKGCERCRVFQAELRRTSRALAAVYPVGLLVVMKKLVGGKLGFAGGGSSAGTGGSGMVGGSTVAGGSAWGGGAVAGGSALGSGLLGGSAGAGGLLTTGVGAIATKAAAGLVAAAVVTAGAVEIRYLTQAPSPPERPAQAAKAPPRAQPAVAAPKPLTAAEDAPLAGVAPGAPTAVAEPAGAKTRTRVASDAPSAPSTDAAPADEPAASGSSTQGTVPVTVSDGGSGGGRSGDEGGGGGSLPVADGDGGSTGGGGGDGHSSPLPPSGEGGYSPPSSVGSAPPGDPTGSSNRSLGRSPVVGEPAGSSY